MTAKVERSHPGPFPRGVGRMFLAHWLNVLRRRRGSHRPRATSPRRGVRPALEPLEARLAPAQKLFTVETSSSSSHLAEVNPSTGAIIQTFPEQSNKLIFGLA